MPKRPIGWMPTTLPEKGYIPAADLPHPPFEYEPLPLPKPPKETWFTGAEFEKVFGLSLPAGWDASYIWDEAYTTPAFTIYTPEGKKLGLEDVGIARTGEWTYGIERAPEASLQEQLMQDPGYWERLREWEALQGIFFKVFPQEDIEELLNEMAISEESQEAFLQSLREIGRTEDTEELLTRMFPEITPEQLDELLGPRMEKLPEATATDLWLQTWGLKPIKETLGYKAAQSFLAGIGDVLIAGGGVSRALGYDEAGEGLSATGLSLQKNLPPYTLGEFDFWDLLNPEFYAVKVARAIPFALSLAPLAIGGFYAGSAVAAAAGLGTIGSWIVGGFAGAALSRPAESAFEAGGAYDDAIARGKTETEAKEEFNRVFRENMLLVGADAWEIAIALAPTPKWVPLRLARSGLVRTTTIGGKMVIVGLSEGGEEIYQDLILRRARGEEWQWDPISKEVFAIGMVMGLGMGLGGDVISSIVNTSKDGLSPALRKEFDEFVARFEEEGFLTEQAELRALDKIAETPEGQKIVADAIEKVKEVAEVVPEVAIPKELTPFVEEAKKYATFEEFEHALFSEEWQARWRFTEGLLGDIAVLGFPKATEAITGGKYVISGRKGLRDFWESAKALPKPPVVPEVPVTEPGMPEVGYQPAMLGEVPAKEVRPVARAKVVQAKLDDYLKLKKYEEVQVKDRITEIKNLLAVKGRLPAGKGTKAELNIELARLEAQKNIAEFTDIEHLTTAIGEVENELGLRQLPYHGGVALNLFPDKTSKQLDEMLKVYYEARGQLLPKGALEPQSPRPALTPAEATTNLAITGKPTLTLAQAEKTLSLFGQYIANPSVENAWELTRELRQKTLAERAGNLKARSQQLIAQEGITPEDAMKQAMRETMSGELPVASTDYLSDLTQEMRDALFGKVYHTLENEPFEMMSTTEALTNALLGRAIPREPGVRGGSAYSRLMRVFGDQPPVFKAIAKGASEQKSLEDIVEGIFHEIGRPPIPVDQTTADYLRAIDKKVKTAEDVAAIEAYREVHPPSLPYEPPIEHAIAQMPMFPRPVADNVIRVLKEIGWSPVDIGNFLRANKASFDFSFWRQQGPMIINHPISFIQANIESWKATWSQKAAEASWERIKRDPLYHIYDQMGVDFLRPLELKPGTSQWMGVEEFGYLTGERTIPRLTMKIPWVKFSSRGFVTGCNEHNWRIFKNHYEVMLRLQEKIASGEIKLKSGEAFNIQKEMTDFAKMLTDFTQRAQLGRLKGLAATLNSLFFAPRATLGRFLTPRHLVSSNPRIRMEAFRNLSTFVTGVGGIVLLGLQLGLWEVEKDPKNAEYMSMRIGNIRLDPWAGYRQFLVFYTRIITGIGISSVTGVEYAADPIRAMENFVRGKAAPLASIILDFWTGRNFIGEEVAVTNVRQWVERISPFALWDIYESYVLEPAKAAWIVLPAIVGAGVQAYTGEWIDNFHKLGVPKYTESLPYGVAEPVYDVRDFWSDTSARFKGVDPATLTEDKGFPPYIRGIAEARIIKEHLSNLPNQSLVSLNTDPAKGATFADYYNMWRDREKIVASGDEEALKAFDADERTRNAHLGNFSQQQFALLNQYYAITDIKEQAEFLEKHHDEIGVNLRKDWLASHPRENAQLAIWGQVDALSRAAYDEARKLIDEYDIPSIAVDEYLPPKDVGDLYFDYLDLLIKVSPSSPEAKLFRLENGEFNNWGMANLGWESTVGWKGMEYYKLEIKLADMDAQYSALGTTEERASFLEENSEYANDRRHRDALNLEIPEDLTETYIDWYTAERSGYEDDWFLMENEDFYQTMVDMEIWKPRDFSKVPTREVFRLYEQWQRMDLGKQRRDFEAKYPELDLWLHLTTGTMLETERD